ncbi:MAG: hypothetical protein AAFR97_11480 [Bacteroidota bacterium]
MPGFSVFGQVNESGTEGVEPYVFNARDDRLADWQSDHYVLLSPNAPVPPDYDHDDYHWYGIYDDGGVISVWPVDFVYRYLDRGALSGRYVFVEFGDQPRFFIGTVEPFPDYPPRRRRQTSPMRRAERLKYRYGPNAYSRGSDRVLNTTLFMEKIELSADIDSDGIKDRITSYLTQRTSCDRVYVLWLSSEADHNQVFKGVSYFIELSDCQ